MKNKVFSLMAVVIFISGITNATTIEVYENPNLCAQVAFDVQTELEEDCVPKRIANELANEAYDSCMENTNQ